jgi:hypothetical protein
MRKNHSDETSSVKLIVLGVYLMNNGTLVTVEMAQ